MARAEMDLAQIDAWLVASPAEGKSSKETSKSRTKKPAKPTKEQLVAILEKNGGSVRATAKHFARDRRQVYRWLEQYGLRVPAEADEGLEEDQE
jgi:transposase-like protein